MIYAEFIFVYLHDVYRSMKTKQGVRSAKPRSAKVPTQSDQNRGNSLSPHLPIYLWGSGPPPLVNHKLYGFL